MQPSSAESTSSAGPTRRLLVEVFEQDHRDNETGGRDWLAKRASGAHSSR